MSVGRKILNLSECRVVGSSAGRSRPGAAQRGYIHENIYMNKFQFTHTFSNKEFNLTEEINDKSRYSLICSR